MGSGPSLALTVCPLSGIPFKDPVVAPDGHTYSQEAIAEWYRFWITENQGGAVLSPLTCQTLAGGVALRKDADAQKALEEAARFYASRSSSEPAYRPCQEGDARTLAGQIASIHALNQPFALLDAYSELLSAVTAAWRPPQLVMLGDENSGKSKLLERLLMMSLFPHSKDVSTSACVQVRLRHRLQASLPRIEIIDTESGQTVHGPYLIAAEAGNKHVLEEMQKLVQEELERLRKVDDAVATKKEPIPGEDEVIESTSIDPAEDEYLRPLAASRMIVVHVDGPHLPSLDLVDLPGLVSQPPEAAAASRTLVEFQMLQNLERSLILATVPASRTFPTSATMQLIEEHDIHSRTVGVFTRCDEVPLHVRNRLDSSGRRDSNQFSKLSCYVAVANPPIYQLAAAVEEKQKLSHGNLLRLQEQASKELEFFKNEGLGDLLDKGLAGTRALQDRLRRMYLDDLLETWASQVVWLLRLEAKRLRFRIAALGPPTPSSRDDIARMRCGIVARAKSQLKSQIGDVANIIADEVLGKMRDATVELIGSEIVTSIDTHTMQWQTYEEQLNGVCKAAISSASECVLKWVESVIKKDDDLPAWPSKEADETLNSTLYVPARFEKFVAAVVARADVLLEPWRNRLEIGMKECIRKIFDDVSPWVKIRLRLAANPPQNHARFLVDDVVEVLFASILRLDLCAKNWNEQLVNSLQEVAEEIHEWNDPRISNRDTFRRQLMDVERTQAELLRVLGAPPKGLEFLETISLANSFCAGVGVHHAFEKLEVRFTINVCDQSGNKISQHLPDDHTFDVTVREAGSKTIKQKLPVIDRGDGTLTVNYTFAPTGLTNEGGNATLLHVEMHGYPICGSPFDLQVSDEPKWPPVGTLVYESKPDDLQSPAGVAVSEDYIYVTDADKHRVNVFNAHGFVRSLGPEHGIAALSAPWGISADEDSLYIVESSNNSVIVVGKNDGVVLQEFGQKGPGDGQLERPRGFCLDGDRAYIADSGNHRIQTFTRTNGAMFEASGSFGSEGSDLGQFRSPWDVDIDGDFIHVCDKENFRVQVFSKLDWRFLFSYGSKGSGNSELWTPWSVSVGGPFSYVSDFGNHRIQVFDKSDGTIVQALVPGSLREPGCLTQDCKSLYVCDKGNRRVQIFSVASFSKV